MAHLRSRFNINHSPRTLHSPSTNGLIEVQNRNLVIHLRLFLQNPPTNWSIGTQMNAYAHNTTPLSQHTFAPHQIVFHTHPRLQITFSLTLTCDFSKTCIATYCNSLPHHTQISNQDLNLFFHSLLNKAISLWLLTAEHALLEESSTVHRHITNKLSSRNSIFEITLKLNNFLSIPSLFTPTLDLSIFLQTQTRSKWPIQSYQTSLGCYL